MENKKIIYYGLYKTWNLSMLLKKFFRLVNYILFFCNFRLIYIEKSEKILLNFSKKNKNLKFIQIGANDGVSFDHLYNIVTKNNWTGIVVEPIPDIFEKLKINYYLYPKIHPLNVAVHPCSSSMVLYRPDPSKFLEYPDWVYGIASFDKNHLIKHNILEQDILNIHVEAVHLMDIIKDNNLYDAEYLQIDTEGFDAEVIKMIDFKLWKPSLIRFELIHLKKGDFIEVCNILRVHGYKITKCGMDAYAFLN